MNTYAKHFRYLISLFLLCGLLFNCAAAYPQEFTKWNPDGAINELTAYVEDVTNENSANYIPVNDRIVVFDLDGTLVGEQFPTYFEWLLFSHRVLDNPSFHATEEMRQVARDILKAGLEKSIPEELEEHESLLYGKVFEGMTVEDYRAYVKNFLSTDADGFVNLKMCDAYFRPMTEVLSYLTKNRFTIYICSGTDRDAVRVVTQNFAAIPSYHIIGSDYYTEGSFHNDVNYNDYQFDPNEKIIRDDTRIIKNVKSAKTIQLAQEIGQKPVLAFGNSSGDASMFVYTTYNNPYKSAAFCVLPDDNEREYAFPSKVVKLTELCKKNGWHTISMKNDFLSMYGDTVQKDETNYPLATKLLNK